MQSKGGASKTSFACKGAREKRRYAQQKRGGLSAAAVAAALPNLNWTLAGPRRPGQAAKRVTAASGIKIDWMGDGMGRDPFAAGCPRPRPPPLI